MVFKDRIQTDNKITIHNTTLEQVNTFTYLGCTISNHEKKDILQIYVHVYKHWKF
jgi:hypothetical protein